MKKLLYIATCVLLGLTGCQKDILNPVAEGGSNQKTEFAIQAAIDSFDSESDADTKAVANAVVRLNWAKGDKLSAVNLTTGKALGGDLISQEEGQSSLFSGVLAGRISGGDRIAFIYPSQGYTEEQDFSGATIDFTHQAGTSAVPLAVYGVATVSSNTVQNISLDFKFLMSYFQINLTELPALETIESVRFPGMGGITTLTINDGKNDLVSSAQDATITVSSANFKTNDRGVKAVYISGFASPKKDFRNVEVSTESIGYKTTWNGASLNVGRYYAAVVTGFKDVVTFDDTNFEAYCIKNFDKNFDGEINKEEALAVTSMSFNSDKIESVAGIRAFKNLEYLDIQGSSAKWSPDGTMVYSTAGTESANLQLLKGTSASGKIRSLDLKGMDRLKYLSVSRTMLEELNVAGCDALNTVSLSYTCLTSIDVSFASYLESIGCEYSQLSEIDVSGNPALKRLYCQNNQITGLDVTKNIGLEYLYCGYNKMNGIDVSKNATLKYFGCDSNSLTSLDISENISLLSLSCSNCQLKNLELSSNVLLTSLYCYGNQLTSLDVSYNVDLIDLDCSNNILTTLDVSRNSLLESLRCSRNQLTDLDVSRTNIGNSHYSFPLVCSLMPSLQTVKILSDWKLNGINIDRSEEYIPEDTRIFYVDGTIDTPPIEEL